ncbi:MAG: hypothetical protein KatS3mg077_2956 [Candidatus Binatia bacterium]|nr:MAG: hypothetical protein KatS3mg077_2956 [Candidatus Binatia bacterium]
MTELWRKVTFFVCHFIAILLGCCALCVLPAVTRADLVSERPTNAVADTSPEGSASLPAAPAQPPAGTALLPVYRLVIGREVRHRVAPGDTPIALARKYRVSVPAILRRNNITDPRRLQIGQELILSDQHIVPAPFDTGLVVDLRLLRLYWLREGNLLATYPIAAGRPAWETPAGVYRITGRRRDPTWYVPPSIQREMQAAGQRVRSRVPPGPDNPLGKYWIQLSAPGIGLHGTNAPWSVGRYATHGCIRLHNEHVERLFNEVPDGTPVAIVDEPVRLARTSAGRIFLEVFDHPELPTGAEFEQTLRSARLSEGVHWPLAEQALSGRWGVAVDITNQNSLAEDDSSRGQEASASLNSGGEPSLPAPPAPPPQPLGPTPLAPPGSLP